MDSRNSTFSSDVRDVRLSEFNLREGSETEPSFFSNKLVGTKIEKEKCSILMFCFRRC